MSTAEKGNDEESERFAGSLILEVIAYFEGRVSI